jgi:hypothetical protein
MRTRRPVKASGHVRPRHHGLAGLAGRSGCGRLHTGRGVFHVRGATNYRPWVSATWQVEASVTAAGTGVRSR